MQDDQSMKKNLFFLYTVNQYIQSRLSRVGPMVPWMESSLWNVSDDHCTDFNRGEERCNGLDGLASFFSVAIWLPRGFAGDLGGVLGLTGVVFIFFVGGDFGGLSVESSF